jgi:phage terminase small subunit
MVLKKTGVTIADIVAELAKLGFSNMRDYVTIAEDGQVQVDVAQAPDGKWAAIQELTSETYTEGKGEDARMVTRTRIKLHGKEAALVDIGKHLGMFDKDRRGSQSDVPVGPQAPSAERLEEMRRRYMPKSKPHLRPIDGGKKH